MGVRNNFLKIQEFLDVFFKELFGSNPLPNTIEWRKRGYVAILALGSRPRQGLTKVRAKNEAWESHFMLLGVQESVR